MIEDTKVVYHDYNTNGIVYLNLTFDITKLPEELIPYASLLKNVLGYVDTEKYSFGELFNEINRKSGGISALLGSYANEEAEEKTLFTYELRAKALEDQLPFIFTMLEEILLRSKLEDEKRLREILGQLKSRMQMILPSSGHATAVNRAMSYFSQSANFGEKTSGIDFYRFVERLEGKFETEKETLISSLKEVCCQIFCPENLVVSVTCERSALEKLPEGLKNLQGCLKTQNKKVKKRTFVPEKKNEGFMAASQVQYVAAAGNFKKAGLSYTGALRVLKVILSYDYLWLNIRVKGGAYGCMSGFSRNGNGYLASYRDPKLRETLEVYKKCAEYLRKFAASDRDMVKYIIGTISDMDVPLSPYMAGNRSMTAYFTGTTEAQLKKEREEVLGCTVEEVRRLADYVEAVMAEEAICVLGNEALLKKEAPLFKNVEPLFQS